MYQAISSRFTHSILAIAVAQLPPPITANFGIVFISILFEKSKILFFYGIPKSEWVLNVILGQNHFNLNL
jgi:hypothetical protein